MTEKITQSQTPLTIIYAKEVTILDYQELEAKGHTLLSWDTYLSIREKPQVDLFLGPQCFNHMGEVDLKTINLWTKARRAQIKAEKKLAKEEAKRAKQKSKQATLKF